MFGLETIIIYTAIMLKKRIIVYHHKLNVLLNYIRALTVLSQHRPGWEHFYPFMELSPIEVAELSNMNHYLAGFRDATAESRLELYDVFINLAAIEVTVAPHSKGSMFQSNVTSATEMPSHKAFCKQYILHKIYFEADFSRMTQPLGHFRSAVQVLIHSQL